MRTFVLVHPPLLGPSVWTPCARAIESLSSGSSALVPDLRGCIDPAEGWWERAVAVCAPLLAEDTVLVGHSGAGVVLPMIAAAGPVREVVFADAVVPARSGVTTPGAGIRAFVAALPTGSHLPRWTDWWDETEVRSLVNDPATLRPIVEEQPRLPADFYDHPVPVPDGWDDAVRCRYVRFSAAYDAMVAEAVERGWQVVDVPGTHLHQVGHAEQMARVLLDGSAPAGS